MRVNRMLAGMVAAGGLLALWVGCNKPPIQTTKPGQLPGDDGDGTTPRLSATTYFAHGHLLERQGDFERAAEQYRQALKLRPEFATARNRLGITLNKRGQHAEATEQFRQALTRQPGSAYLYNNLGFSLYLEHRYAESEAALRRALELRPTFSRARMNHAIVLAKLGRFDESFEGFCAVGSRADAHYNVAMIQADSGHYAAASRSLESALALNPQLEPARQKLAHVTQLLELGAPSAMPPQPVVVSARPAEEYRAAATMTPPQAPRYAQPQAEQPVTPRVIVPPTEIDATSPMIDQDLDEQPSRPAPPTPQPLPGEVRPTRPVTASAAPTAPQMAPLSSMQPTAQIPPTAPGIIIRDVSAGAPAPQPASAVPSPRTTRVPAAPQRPIASVARLSAPVARPSAATARPTPAVSARPVAPPALAADRTPAAPQTATLVTQPGVEVRDLGVVHGATPAARTTPLVTTPPTLSPMVARAAALPRGSATAANPAECVDDALSDETIDRLIAAIRAGGAARDAAWAELERRLNGAVNVATVEDGTRR